MTKMKNRGFTLIELLIVIAIIAILAGIIVATLGNPTGEARDSKRCQAVDSIGDAAQQYLIGEGASEYPATLDALITEGYLPSEPMDPKSTVAVPVNYYYAVCTVDGGTKPRVVIGTELEVDKDNKAPVDFGTLTCDAATCVDDVDNPGYVAPGGNDHLCKADGLTIDCSADDIYCIVR